jgi:hypothetical protein
MTIAAIRTTILRVPWPQTPWLKGHAFGDARNILVLEVETEGGIVYCATIWMRTARQSG